MASSINAFADDCDVEVLLSTRRTELFGDKVSIDCRPVM